MSTDTQSFFLFEDCSTIHFLPKTFLIASVERPIFNLQILSC